MSSHIEEDERKSVTNVSDIIGDWGKWQLNICLFATSMAVFSAFNNMAGAFYAPKIDFRCVSKNQTMDFQCPPPGSNITCDSYVYDHSIFKRTIVEEWDLVCERSWLPSFTQSVYMVGVVISALMFGYLSDRYGRVRVLYAGIALEIIGGIASAMSGNAILFTISRLVLSIGCYGRNLTAFLIGIECVGPKYRARVGIAYQFGWAFGYVMLPVIAYFCKDYVKMMLITTIPELLWLIWLWRIPETPKWLISKGHYEEAEVILRQALQFNGKRAESVKEHLEVLRSQIDRERLDKSSQREVTFLDLWKSNGIRNFTLILYFTWFVNAFVYYGISFNIGDFGGDLFVNFGLAGLVEVPSYLATIVAFNYIGRRKLTAYLMVLAGISCIFICMGYVFESLHGVIITSAMLGKFTITATFGIIYVYSAELYPTVLRQFAVGSCSIAGRVGSILAPFIKELSEFTHIGFSMGIFAFFSILDGLLVFLLPETNDQDMPDTLDESSKIGKQTVVPRSRSTQELND